MFNLNELQNHYRWKIIVKMPKNGSFEKIPVYVNYFRLPHDEKLQLLNEIDKAQGMHALESEDKMLNQIFQGWDEGEIKNGKENLPNTEENRQKLLNISEFRLAIMEGFLASMGGDKGKSNA